MADVKLTDARRIAILTEKVRGILEVALIGGPVDANELLALIGSRGVGLTPAEITTIRAALVADGTIEVV